MNRIVVVEDDPAILRGLADNLKYESYEVLTAADGEAGYRLIREMQPDLIILDVMLPKLDGYELCRRVRAEGVTTPILMLTSRGEEADRVLGLDLGASDYVTKPFFIRELLARVRAILRQQHGYSSEQFRLGEEVQVAFRVQQRLLPQRRPQVAGLDYCAFCLPAHGVSGDFYDFLDLGEEKLGLLVADVSGKGMPAALLTATLHACFHTHRPRLGELPDELFRTVNALLFDATDPGRYATAFYGSYDARQRTLTYVNAGHPPPILARPDAPPDAVRLDSATTPLGLFETLDAEPATLALRPGDGVVIFSDGVTDALDARREPFGRERLANVLAQNGAAGAADLCQAILADLLWHSGGQPPADDQTAIALRVLPEPGGKEGAG